VYFLSIVFLSLALACALISTSLRQIKQPAIRAGLKVEMSTGRDFCAVYCGRHTLAAISGRELFMLFACNKESGCCEKLQRRTWTSCTYVMTDICLTYVQGLKCILFALTGLENFHLKPLEANTALITI